MMLCGEFFFKRVYKGVAFWARVTVEVDTSTEDSYINMLCNGKGIDSEGCGEEVTANGYEDWKLGAIEGVKYALDICSHPNYGVSIKKIEGLTTDTTPTVVGIATAYAIWNAIGYNVPEDVVKALEEKVAREYDRKELGRWFSRFRRLMRKK